MSEGSITYQSEGELCGIFTVINSELKNFLVCNDGLTCVNDYFSAETNAYVKSCHSVNLPSGALCNPTYKTCDVNIDCLRNEFEEYTCGGQVTWKGNPPGINSSIIHFTKFKPDIALVIGGIILLLIDIIIYLYYYQRHRKNHVETASYEKIKFNF